MRKTRFSQNPLTPDFDLLESNSIYIFVHENQKNLPWIIFFSRCMFRTHVLLQDSDQVLINFVQGCTSSLNQISFRHLLSSVYLSPCFCCSIQFYLNALYCLELICISVNSLECFFSFCNIHIISIAPNMVCALASLTTKCN